MGGGGGSRAIKNFFFKFCFALKSSTIIYFYINLYIVVEVTLDRVEYGSQQSEQPENVNFQPIIRGLNRDIFDREKH